MIACYDIEILRGADLLMDLVESVSFDRRYILPGEAESNFVFDDGVLHVLTKPGFMFDGRSGTPLLDWFAPNLGSLVEREGWWMHDCLAYAQSLDFWHTNRALRLVLRDQAGYCRTKAWTIEKAVSLSKSWYGTPKQGDWAYMNIGKVETWWEKKVA